MGFAGPRASVTHLFATAKRRSDQLLEKLLTLSYLEAPRRTSYKTYDAEPTSDDVSCFCWVRYYTDEVSPVQRQGATQYTHSIEGDLDKDQLGLQSHVSLANVQLKSHHHSPVSLDDKCVSVASICKIAEETHMLALSWASIVSTGDGVPPYWRKSVEPPTSVSLLQSENKGGHSWTPFCGQLRRSGGCKRKRMVCRCSRIRIPRKRLLNTCACR